MSNLDEIYRIFGRPSPHGYEGGAWREVEDYLGLSLPVDFKEFVDAYGPGMVCGELVIFHPLGPTPLLERMKDINESFGGSWRSEPGMYPFSFFPNSGGLISWGYDYSGDEHFFWPCDESSSNWKIVTNVNGSDPEVFDGSFVDFVLNFARELRYWNPDAEISSTNMDGDLELDEFIDRPPYFEPIS
ncbi:hypothetical protein [Kitasatospora purpeofusca]|uniref:hypothetical protein n=1 Tax=Kitasatospora purpeofusca TaxID=67352 RepID=UPI002A5AFA94|nr:hypothetical protein [Kitasatospora purpeofusca]MDY0815648.1 hypothetical protein [Kitasatospora purpeofusca]